jgi:phytoene dehydrogenase-like protein
MKKVVIVGGGISGLTAGCFSQGDITIIEKNEKCGGLVNSFVKDGFRFEGGVRALLNSGIIFPMLEKLNLALDVLPNYVSVGVEDKIIDVKSKENIKDYEIMLKSLYPENTNEISNFIKVVKKMVDYIEILYSVKNPLFADKSEYFKYLPWILKALKVFMAMKNMNIPVEKYLKKFFKNNSLIDIISQHFFKNIPAFYALSYFYIYTDYFYLKGGLGTFPKKLEEYFLKEKGEILYNTKVVSVDVEKKVVLDQNGKKYPYDILIWAADLKELYKMVNLTSRKFLKEKEKILNGKPAESVYTLYLAVDVPPEEFKRISHGHFFYAPCKKGLGDIHRKEIKNLISYGTKKDILNWIKRFVKYNTFEISIPVLKDETAAPKGKTGVIVSVLLDYEIVKKVYDEGWYEEFKEKMDEAFIDVLSDSIYPFLKNNILFKFSSSPISIQNYANTSDGSIIGWGFEEKAPIKNNFQKAALTSIPHVYKAGKWAYTPSGVPMAILTGKIASKYTWGVY